MCVESTQYRVKYGMPEGLEQYAPDCKDTRPAWSTVPAYLASATPSVAPGGKAEPPVARV